MVFSACDCSRVAQERIGRAFRLLRKERSIFVSLFGESKIVFQCAFLVSQEFGESPLNKGISQ